MPTPLFSPSHDPTDIAPLGAHDPVRLGPYRLTGRLGFGGMGTVYLARSPFGRTVAVKAVHPELVDEPEFRERFAREVTALRRVRSRFVPRFAGASPRADIPWLATGHIPGPTLHEQVRNVRPLRDGALARVVTGVAAALADIHRAGIVHSDLKPGNVILSPRGPRVLDFGVATRRAEQSPHGPLWGTPGWVAPERLRGFPASAASDVFNWAQLTAYSATGRNPFGAGTPEATARRILRGEADLIGLPGEFLPTVRAALAASPALRPTPEQILSSLNRAGVTRPY
ncbi:serine/threonine-protein kinase [Nocardiopsis sp. MG754419]|uniref:serine/threonine-protein kinase n=1 Tax=Nocardiopsis sp. MG754419 TaxID=2259865 RepID=UPI001BAC975D|nr:serine/threonine-protein kinase [Nocardiopsis sp. MG754419]MBR8744076.1 serine/threonine protein kinase [Nocardiopsis sp. MG754419]